MSLTNLLVPTHRQMLGALRGWLDKAEAQFGAGEAEALLSARLAPDMFPLATQVRFACVQVIEAAHRLRGLPFPARVEELLDEGRNAGEQPGSLAQARARIDETLALLGGLAPDALDMAPDTAVVHELSNGMVFDLTAEQYARDWALGQFYFHVMIAYAILRNAGIALGKADYVGHLLPYLRQ
ncbi:MAG: DUF1993 domain-containing protein [Novosphingobium sp.]